MTRARHLCAITALTALAPGCMSSEPEGLAPSQQAGTTVKMDFFHEPLPEIPLPNDIATRSDPNTTTGRRINASMVAPTHLESHVRELIDGLDGWGTFQPITIPFTGPIDVQSVLDGHRDADYDLGNDVVYVVNVDRGSPAFGRAYHLDFGNGNYPVALERPDKYWHNDPRGHTLALAFEETHEDVNGNGVLDLGEDVNGNRVLDPGEDLDGDGELDPPEDTDADGILDEPNYYPGAQPAFDDIGARVDAMMTFYERQTNTLIARTLVPLDERTTYAVVVTRRLRDANGDPVGSPYPFVNHTAQTRSLRPLLDVLPAGLAKDDIAFAFSFTTQSVQTPMIAVRDGLYGHGVQAHLGRDFPAELAGMEKLRADNDGVANPYLLHGEVWGKVYAKILTEFSGGDSDSEETRLGLEGQKYIDYVVVGSFESPQLFQRDDGSGRWLPFNDQRWPEDLDRTPAQARSETVYFTLTVPRKEVSVRGEGKPAPVVITSHGYTSNRFEGLGMAGYFARHGMAMLSIDGPSHGLPLSEIERALVRSLASSTTVTQGETVNLSKALDAFFKDRAHNQDNDPDKTMDSASDFWTGYLFHTRDVVRQFALDYMQLVRIVRGFDGQGRWDFDLNGDGQPELAGDFDGDGFVDIGEGSMLGMVGGSLGGIMSMLVGSLEPEMDVVTPIAGGGGFGDMGIRTTQGGAVEGFILHAMAPFFTGTLDPNTGKMKLEAVALYLNDDRTVTFATVDGVQPWDTMVVENTSNGERGCGYVNAAGQVRAHVASDLHDGIRVLIYDGPALAGGTECEIRPGRSPRVVVDTFEQEVKFGYDEEGMDIVFEAGAPLVTLCEGYGLKRATPDLRRFVGLGQLVLDSADPAAFARHLSQEPLFYPGTGQTTGAHAMVVTTMGDTAVPASSGVTFGRAAGFIDYLTPDPRYGVPVNQVLLDNYVAEGIHTTKRFTDSSGQGIHIDVENFSGGDDLWGGEIPRLDPPLRIGFDATDPLGGVSASIFPFPQPQGQHGFDRPGKHVDKARSRCRSTCSETGVPDPCGCSTATTFDTGSFMYNLLSRYMKSGGKAVSVDLCQSRNDCADMPPAPPFRSKAERP